MQPQAFADAVLNWFDQHGRKNLPWQVHKTAYHTWVSEIMLQQTQVVTVIPYFNRFIARFPDVQTLASTPVDEVLHHWTGLGYYARARNLHKAAQQILTNYQGQFPTQVEQLEQLPGIGRSTAAAIASIAFNAPATILDGNVKRVLARYQAIEGWSGHSPTLKKLWQLAEQLTPTYRNADYTQAMMDLGATLCTRSNPKCDQCPLLKSCAAYAQQRIHELPTPKPKRVLPIKATFMLVIQKNTHFLLEQRPANGIWGGLWSFPEFNSINELSTELGIEAHQIKPQPSFRHTFTHYHLEITPLLLIDKAFQNQPLMASSPTLWYNPKQPNKVGLAAPVKRLIKRFTLE